MLLKALDFRLSHPNAEMERPTVWKAALLPVDNQILFKWVNILSDPISSGNSHQLDIIAMRCELIHEYFLAF